MFTFVSFVVVAIAAFVAGLLVGRRNPGIANAAATVANEAKSGAGAAVDQVKKL